MGTGESRGSAVRFAAGFVAAGAVCLALPAAAFEFDPGGDVEGRLKVTFTAGTHVRTESPDPAVLGTLSAPRVGLPPGQLSGNAGGGDLNFEKNRPVSTVVKGLLDLELKRQNLGLFLRGYAWYDLELKDGDRPYGNYPNGFRQNAPLGDDGFARSARFSGAQFRDAYVFGTFPAGEGNKIEARLGRQIVNWGVAQIIGGGVNIVNGVDFPAATRPGALPEETRVPTGMLHANLTMGGGWGVEGWYQYEFRPYVLSPCGTFWSSFSYSPEGCNYASVGIGNDPAALANGTYPKRLADDLPPDSGQWGLSARYLAKDIGTEFRAYAMNYHSRWSLTRVVNPDIAGGYGTFNPGTGSFTRLTDPNGLKYQMVYPEDIRTYGVSFDSRPGATLRLYGEATYRPKLPLGINASDLIAAFLTRSPVSALNLAKNTNAIPAGGSFDGWDRFAVGSLTLGGGKAFPRLAGAEKLTLGGEVGWMHIAGLPDPGRLRYGRSDDYGQAAVAGGAPCAGSAKSCALDGFFTTNSWGYRLRAAADYPGAFLGATLSPSLLYSKDVKGYSYTTSAFIEDRWSLRPALRADWKSHYAEIQYWRTGGGRYNVFVDRDVLTLFAGLRF